MFNFLKGPFRRRIFLALLLISVVPLFIAGVITSFMTGKSNRQNLREGSELYLNQINNSMDDLAKRTDYVTQMAFSDKNLQEVLRNPDHYGKTEQMAVIDQFILNLSTVSQATSDILIVTDSQVFSRTRSASSLTEYLRYGQSWYYEAVMKNGGMVITSSRPRPYDKSLTRTVTMSREILDMSTPQRERLGFLVVEIDPDYIAEQCGTANEFGESTVVMIDPLGYILYSSTPVENEAIDLPRETYQGDRGSKTVLFQGEEQMLNYVTSADTGWKILQFIPERYIGQLGTEVMWANIGVIAACAVAAVLISAILTNMLTEPIYRLRGLVRRIGAGELGVTEDDVGDDIVGELGNCINTMSRNLETLVHRNYEMKLRNKEAELRSLQNQINPHFLYNTLASIQLMAVYQKQPEIARMVEDLGAFFHLSISTGDSIVPLSQELRLVELYINLQKVRFGERIHYSCEVDETLYNLPVPKLILQPLVENAVIHGLEEKLTPGTVRLTVERKETCVLITITDDGVGMDEKQLELCRQSLRGEGKKKENGRISIGMHNVEARLRLYSGGKLGLSIESEREKGTSVYISLPPEGVTMNTPKELGD